MPVRKAALAVLILLCVCACARAQGIRVIMEGFAFDLPEGWTERRLEPNNEGVIYAAVSADGRAGLAVRQRALKRGESVTHTERRWRMSRRVSCTETEDAEGVPRLIAREQCGDTVQLAVAAAQVDGSRVELIFYDETGENPAAETVVGSLCRENTKEDLT